MTISATTQGVRPGVCLSTNRPAAPFDGQVIYMTDVDQTAVWDGTQWVVLAPIAGGRNVIINGAMNVWQRGTSFSGNYTTDRWIGTSNAGSQTWSRSTDVPTGFTYSISQASTTGTNPQIQQLIESVNIRSLVGKIVTVSFYAKSTAGSSQLSLFTAYPTATDNWAAQTTDSAGSTNFTLTSSWARYSFSYTLSSSATTGYKVVLYRNESSASSTTLVTGVQLEAGAVATPFEFEDFGVTLRKCQRYYEKTYNIGTNPATATQLGMVGNDITASANHSNYIIARFPYKVTKRAAPTVTTYDASGNAGKAMAFNVGAAGTDNFTVTADFVGEHSFRAYLLGINSAGFTIHYTANAEL